MHLFRIYAPTLGENTQSEFVLTKELSHRVLNVLRLTRDSSLILFDGHQKELLGRIVAVDKKKPLVIVQLTPFASKTVESPLFVHLAQAVSRGEKMDYTIQKSVELGVNKITPLFTKRGEVKLLGERLQRRLEHWQAVAVNACEQSGRVFLPNIETPPRNFTDWLAETQRLHPSLTKFILDPYAPESLSRSALKHQVNDVMLLVGPESGFDETEVEQAKKCGFRPVHLGPRTLRTETAGPVGAAVLQSCLGDM